MNKKDFIQKYVIANSPLPKGVNAIQFSEALWAKLSARGYGHKSAEPRDFNKDWYKELSEQGKARFDEFWASFALKKGRNNAAMRWHQMELNGISDKELEQIIFASKKEAEDRLNRPAGSVPIMAQGWLNNMRWIDVKLPTESQKNNNEKNEKIRELKAQIQHAKTMLKSTQDSYWNDELLKAEKELKKTDKVGAK